MSLLNFTAKGEKKRGGGTFGFLPKEYVWTKYIYHHNKLTTKYTCQRNKLLAKCI